MRALDLIHRWAGGLIGLLLAVLGLSGTILVHKEAWLRWALPHAADAQRQDGATLAAAADRAFSGPDAAESILFATEGFGLNRLGFGGETGAYADQAGQIVTRWDSVWDRPELWLFDLHHHLLTGKTGETVAAIVGLVGVAFVLTGLFLWWERRKTFAFRLWPRRLSRPAIVRHHRDLGVVAAPLLIVSMLTGAMMTLRPVSDLLLSPLSAPAEMRAAVAPPEAEGGPMNRPDWRAMIEQVRAHFPGAEIRVIRMPGEAGGLITLRARQPAEWLPNGRTLFWFDPADGRLVDHRDALAMPAGSRLFNLLYPVHASKVGGLAYRLVMTFAGLALTLLGSLAVLTFWSSRGRTGRSGRRRTEEPACRAEPV